VHDNENAFKICELQLLLAVDMYESCSRRRKTLRSFIRLIFIQSHVPNSPNSSVGIATELSGLDGPGIESR